MSIFEVLFFLTLLVYTAPHIMVFGAVICGASLGTAKCVLEAAPDHCASGMAYITCPLTGLLVCTWGSLLLVRRPWSK